MVFALHILCFWINNIFTALNSVKWVIYHNLVSTYVFRTDSKALKFINVSKEFYLGIVSNKLSTFYEFMFEIFDIFALHFNVKLIWANIDLNHITIYFCKSFKKAEVFISLRKNWLLGSHFEWILNRSRINVLSTRKVSKAVQPNLAIQDKIAN